jgi:glycosyltransferase involved in cell wall biosynthesis
MGFLSVAAIITTHRRPLDLAHAIASVQSQTVPVQEIIVCEDGHDDATREVVAEAARADARTRHVHVAPPQRGAGANRNAGLAATECEWVAFLDDDDRWLPDKIERQAPLATGVELVCANANRSSGGSYFRPGRPHRITRRQLLLSNPVITSTAVVRRSALKAVDGFSPDFRLLGVEDYECWLRLSDAGARFAYLDRPVVDYADAGDDRLSARAVGLAGVVASIAWQRALRERTDAACWAGAGRHAATLGTVRARSLVSRASR